MNGDEQLLGGRVYGRDHDDPNPGPLPHRTYAMLVGGPLDGMLLGVADWRPEQIDSRVALSTEPGRWPGRWWPRVAHGTRGHRRHAVRGVHTDVWLPEHKCPPGYSSRRSP
ncbi:hypothetical protein [Streptomyces sp. NPDC056983]|uniref:hypothetical protein n=1 Tax=Streptomyces sp. NPDC056983 TaxID=3345987 RepID=UPI003627CA41